MKQIKQLLLVAILMLISYGAKTQQLTKNQVSKIKAEYAAINNPEISYQQFEVIRTKQLLRTSSTPYNGCGTPNHTHCGNGDFETGIDPNEWQGADGYYPSSSLYPPLSVFYEGLASGPIYYSTSHQTSVDTLIDGVDPIVGIKVAAPNKGGKSVRLGNSVNGCGTELISKTLTVSGTNPLYSFWYALVLEDPQHNYNEQPAFSVRVFDCTTGAELSGVCDLGNGTNIAVSDRNNPFFTNKNGGSIVYRDWSCAQINLSQYVGKKVNIIFMTKDCALSGHYGYAYIDNFGLNQTCNSCKGNPSGYIGQSIRAVSGYTCGNDQICTEYTLPKVNGITGTVNIKLTIYQNGIKVDSLFSGNLAVDSAVYCFNIIPKNLKIDTTLNGFDYVVEGLFNINTTTLAPQIAGFPPDGQRSGFNNDYKMKCITSCVTSQSTACQNTGSIPIIFSAQNGTAPYTFTYTLNGGSYQTISTTGLANSVTLDFPTSNAGVYTINIITIAGSDLELANGNCSTTLNIKPISNSVSNVTACNSYTWNAVTYTTSGTYTQTGLVNSNGCDSTAILNLVVNESTHNTITITSSGAYTWNGTTYTSSGTYAYSYVNGNGCLSADTLILTISTPGCWKEVSAGGRFTIALKNDGTLWAWGDNSLGQLGNGTNTSSNIPIQIGTASDWKTISAGNSHTLALKTNGTMWAWGTNNFGELGDGTNTNSKNPIQIGTDNDWKIISAGSVFSVAIKNNGTLWAWGTNNNGTLGNGTYIDQNQPIQVGTASNWSYASAGNTHVLAIKNNGTLWAWGNNINGALGDGTTTNRNAPVQIGTSTNWLSASSGKFYHSLALKTDGTLWAWGGNSSGAVGDGTYTNRNSPVQVGNSTNWQSITAGYSFSAAIKTNGSFWVWGSNYEGLFGNGTSGSGGVSNIPLQLGNNNNWQGVSTGFFSHVAATQTDASLWTWGDNTYGQLGDGSSSRKTQPTNIACPGVVCATTFSTTNTTICSTDLPYTWNGNSYNAAGTYVVHLTNAAGCDSAATLNLTVNTPTSSTTNTSICNAGLPYTWNGNSYNAAGTYVVHLTNAAGCDSTATLNLTIIGASQIISNTSFNVYGTATQNGSCITLTQSYQSYATAAAWNTTPLDFSKSFDLTFTTTQSGSGDGMMLVFQNNGPTSYIADLGGDLGYYGYQSAHNYYNQSVGIEFDLYANSEAFYNDINRSHIALVKNKNGTPLKGPFSISPLLGSGGTNTIRVVWNPSSKKLEFYINSNMLFSHTEDFVNTVFGGNNLVTFGFTAGTGGATATQTVCMQSLLAGNAITTTTQTQNVSGCDYVIFNGVNYITNTTFIDTLKTLNGCDSVYKQINIVVKKSTSSSNNLSICSSQLPYTWNGLTFNTAGSQTAHLTNAAGCDSAATLNLKVNQPTVSVANKSICTAGLPYIWNGNSYNTSGTYTAHLTNAAGCDSTATLNLTVIQSSSSTDSLVICSNALPYTWNGLVFGAAGSQTAHLTNSKGCDSVATLILKVNNSTPFNISSNATSNTICSGSSVQLTASVTTGSSTTQLSNAVVTGSLFGYSGTTSVCDCPTGYVAVGYVGASGAWMDKFSLICKKLNSDGTLGTQIAYTNSIGASPTGSNYTNNSGNKISTGDMALTSLNVTSNYYTSYGNYLGSIQGTATPISSILNNNTQGSSLLGLFGFSGASLGTASVPVGNVIVGIEGSSIYNSVYGNSYVGGIKLRYAPIIATTTTNGALLWSTGATTSSITVNPSVGINTYSATYTNTENCASSAQISIKTNAATSSVTNSSICSSSLPYTWNGLTFNSGGTQTAHLTNAVGCDSAATLNLTVTNCSPTIISFAPTSGYNGTSITIYGSNFTGTTSVTIGNVSAVSFTVINDSTITAVVGQTTSGSVKINKTTGNATKNGFIYLNKISFSVDITNYLLEGNLLDSGGVRIAGNFSDLGGSLPNWQPTAASCKMTRQGNSNLYNTVVLMPDTSKGRKLFYKFVNGNWGKNEGKALNSGLIIGNCGISDGFGSFNRVLTLPLVDSAVTFCWDQCGSCVAASLPTVSTGNISSITSNSVSVVNNNLISTGGASVVYEGVIYSTTNNPNFYDNSYYYYYISNPSLGSYNNPNISFGLSPNTTYYIRAFASNIVGTAYGAVKTFKTPSNGCVTTNSTTVISACDSYLWNGVTYTQSGTYSKTLVGANSRGCDSVATLNLTINTTVTPSLTISTLTNRVCALDTVTFNATSNNGGSSPVYQWKKNGINLTTGTSITFAPNTLTTGDVISCVLTANNSCQTTATAVSNTITLTVNQNPIAATISSQYGNNTTAITLCDLGSVVSLYPSIANGVWSSSNTAIASVANVNSSSSTANLTSISNGIVNIVYTLTTPNTTCTASSVITVNIAKQTSPSTIIGGNNLCVGVSSSYSSSPSGGLWTAARGTFNGNTFTPSSSGNTTITYKLTNSSGCSSSTSLNATINAQPSTPSIAFAAGTTGVSGSGGYCKNKTFTLVGTPTGGTWSSTGVVSITSTGIVNTGATTGAFSVTYKITDVNGCSNNRTIPSNVVSCTSKGVNEQNTLVGDLIVYPNPAHTIVYLQTNNFIGQGSIIITDVYGKVIKQQTLSLGTNTINVSGFAKGIYFVTTITEQAKRTKKIIVD